MGKLFKLTPFVLIFVFIQSCTNSGSRKTASDLEPINYLHYHNENALQKFESLVNEDLSSDKINTFQKLVRQHQDFYAVTQGLVQEFDTELEKAYQKKLKTGEVSTLDFQKLGQKKSTLQAAWQFSEKISHELKDMYLIALENANNPNSLDRNKMASKFVLEKMNSWLDQAWSNGDQMATISLAQQLSQVGKEFQLVFPKSQIIQFDRYTNIDNNGRQKAFDVSVKNQLMRSRNLLEKNTINEWSNFFKQNNTLTEKDFYPDRSPQAEVSKIHPSADSKGNINGSQFPKNMWALTFDDGPHPVQTEAMFNVLKANSTHGTFFWLTKNIFLYPNLVLKAKEFGFHRASHSYTHPQLTKLTPEGLKKEITDASQGFFKITNQYPTFFRCPYGACGGNNSKIRSLIAENNMIHVSWNVDTLDWQDKNPRTIFERTKKQIELQGRGIVLFHDIHHQSVEALKLLIPYMKNEKKLDIRPLSEIVSIVREKPYVSP